MEIPESPRFYSRPELSEEEEKRVAGNPIARSSLIAEKAASAREAYVEELSKAGGMEHCTEEQMDQLHALTLAELEAKAQLFALQESEAQPGN